MNITERKKIPEGAVLATFYVKALYDFFKKKMGPDFSNLLLGRISGNLG